MLVKDMFLKNNNLLKAFLIIFFCNNSPYAEEVFNKDVIPYLQQLKNCSFSFIQSNGLEISEGTISIGSERIRIDYKTPSNIIIVLDENKGMYYNVDLDEDEFFNPKNTSASFFFKMFKNPDFFSNAKYLIKDKNIVVIKDGLVENQKYKLEIYFEDQPILLRKILLELSNSTIILSIFDYKKNESFSRNHFKLINPNFFN